MFTGIIVEQVKITDIDDGSITIQLPTDSVLQASDMHIWQSIAHDGACMSLTELHPDGWTFFAMAESFAKTHYHTKKIGDTFNIELCMQATDRLDGHFVTGHIDTVWAVKKIDIYEDGSWRVEMSFDPKFDALLVPKWSVTINGIALTVWEVTSWTCSVYIIPQTLEKTNISDFKVWTQVNLEFDLLAKYVTKWGRE